MTGYWVNDTAALTWLIGFICTIPLIGFLATMLRRLATARIVTWMFVIMSVFFVERLSVGEPSGTRMLLIIATLLWSMKSVVYVEARHDGKCRLTFRQWLAFCIGWFGMRAELFKNVPGKPRFDWREFVSRGMFRVAGGAVLIGAAWGVAHSGDRSDTGMEFWRRWIATALLLPGLSLFVHFGIFNILTGTWRFLGARCTTLFRAPLLSQSLSEFWGKRWNLAFSEMTALAVYRPLKRLPGRPEQVNGVATFGAFLFSGLLHELAISVPVGAGYGMPTLYFLIHGIGTLLEKRLSFLDSPFIGRAWTMAWVILPLPILFHRPFLEGCVWPIIQI